MVEIEQYTQDPEFTKRQISDAIWYITGSKGCDSYVVIGSRCAAVIDTGENRRNLKKFVKTITDKPLIVCNTHGHFDHTGANGQFKEYPIYMSQFACDNCKTPHNYLNPQDYDLDYVPQPIREGSIIDLGDHILEVYEVPCHSPGSLAYLDRKARMLFTGDEVEAGQVLIYGDIRKMCSVERYRDNMKRLKDLSTEYDFICPGHNGSPVYKSIVDDYLICCEKILGGEEGKKKVSGPSWLSPMDPRTAEDKARILEDQRNRRMEYGGASLVYSVNHIYYHQEISL